SIVVLFVWRFVVCFFYCCPFLSSFCCFFFFFNDTATTEIYTLSLHDALPICRWRATSHALCDDRGFPGGRSEEHTSELQSRSDLVCSLLLEKNKIVPFNV